MIAGFLGGEIVGDKECKVTTVSKIEEGADGTLSFLSNLKYEKHIYTTKSTIVIVNKSFKPSADIPATMIKVDDAYSAFAKLLELYAAQKSGSREGVNSLSFVDEGTVLPDDIYVGAFVSIGKNVKIGSGVKIYANVSIDDNVTIGDDVIIYSGVNIYDESVIGSRVIIHSGAVIGSDGFGFAPVGDSYSKIPQIGKVILEDDVEIGANTTIDRSTMGATVVAKGVKLDNLVQIAHNVTIGENTVIAAQSGIAGSSRVGANCVFAGQTGVVGHVNITNRVTVASKSGVTKDVKKEGTVMLGMPANEAGHERRVMVARRRLPDMANRLNTLEKQLDELKSLISK